MQHKGEDGAVAQDAPNSETLVADVEEEEIAPGQKKVPKLLKVFGALLLVWGALEILLMLLGAVGIWALCTGEIDIQDVLPGTSMQKPELVLLIALVASGFVLAVLDFRLGLGLVKNKRAKSALRARAIMILLVVQLVLNILFSGVGPELNLQGISILGMIGLQIYLDPSLAQERELDRKLRRLDARSREEERLEHLRKYGGKAPFKLTFFNLFWTFVICCVLGVIIETIYCLAVGAGYMDRAGLLYGPFSPIYGFGAVLMTIGLNGIRDKNPVIIFMLSAVIGGAFEFLVSYLLEMAFGITAWDYTGSFLSIDGRTNGFYMCAWGILGLVWVKLLMPAIFDLVHKIPWNWRYGVTVVALVLLLIDGGLTLVSYDRWFSRQVGIPAATAVEQFCDDNYPDDWMANRFQTMTMDASKATR